MPGTPNVLHPVVSGLPLSGSDLNDNLSLIESAFLDIGSIVVSGLVPSIGTGLSVNVTAGVAVIGAPVTMAAFSISGLTASNTNYLYLLQNGTGSHNTTGTPPANSVFLGTATTSGSAVTAVSTVGVPGGFAPRDTGGHLLLSGGTAPAIVASGGAGTSPPSPLLTGNDERGTLSFGTGTGAGAGNMVAVTFAQPYATAPVLVVTALNAASAALLPYVSTGPTAFVLAVQAAPASSQPNTTYAYSYLIVG